MTKATAIRNVTKGFKGGKNLRFSQGHRVCGMVFIPFQISWPLSPPCSCLGDWAPCLGRDMRSFLALAPSHHLVVVGRGSFLSKGLSPTRAALPEPNPSPVPKLPQPACLGVMGFPSPHWFPLTWPHLDKSLFPTCTLTDAKGAGKLKL